MKAGILKEATQLANKVGYVFVATADASKRPHVAVARTIKLKEDGRIAVQEWFCPGTMSNLETNSNVSVIVWDKDTDVGYQMIGKMENILDMHMTNGYVPKIEKKQPLPDVERQILIHLNRVVDFKRAPHSDIEE